MNKFDELLNKLNSNKIIQNYWEWQDNIPKDIWNEFFEGTDFKVVAEEINIERHRWYESSITVVKIFDKFLGIRHITGVYSEEANYTDFDYEIEFKEMEQYNDINYR